MFIGKVYKLEKEGCDHCYIGSTYSGMSVRLAHHRQHHRRGERDYKGLFDDRGRVDDDAVRAERLDVREDLQAEA